MRGSSLALVLCVVAAHAAVAESPWRNVADPVFLRIDQSALPHPAVYAVTQDADGFLWAGTPGGLARYDGYRFRAYLPNRDHPNAPPGVQALAADPAGKLWIGTPSNGLASLDQRTDTFRAWRADPSGRTGPRSATVIALARSPDGKVWVGGDSGLDLFDPTHETFARADLGEPQPRVEAILVDHEHTVWVATVRGLFRRARSEPSFRRVEDFGTRSFFSLHEDSAAHLWAGSVDTVFVLGADRRLMQTYASNKDGSGLGPGEQWGIIEIMPGIVWVASYDGGISIVDTFAGRIRRVTIDRGNPGGLTPGDVWQFFRDRSGLIWIANGPGGLLAHNPRNRGIFELASADKHLGAGDIGARTVAAAADGTLWLGGADDVVHLDPQTGASTTFPVPDHRTVQVLHSGAAGTLWIGTVQGLCRLAPQQTGIDCRDGLDQSVGRVFAILETGGTLWIGSGSGVFAIDEKSGAVTRYRHGPNADSLSNDFATVLAADRAGRIWVGTTSGLNRIDPRTGRVTRIVSGSVSSIVEDRRGRIWAGMVGGPLVVLTERNGGVDVRRLGASEEVPENIAGIAEGADGTIWASATNVLASIDPRTFRARTLGPADGVEETEFWTRGVSTARDGTIFFAGTLAVTAIAPDARADWIYAPPLRITALSAGGRTIVNGAQTIELPAGRRDISVEFAALDYSAPGALRYAYTLDGYRGGWVDADSAHRVATYTNLAPGNYTLRVRGTNRLGVWSKNTVALDLRALPAWYETWWFRALLVLALAVAVLAVIRARTRILHERAERLERVVADRTHELAEANAALENMTITDALTGLRNRRFLTQRIDQDVALALRQETDLVFFLVDIDHFKAVNDELGHAAGDQVLQQMRERLEHVFRSSDYVLRWGGEEFLAVTRGSRREDAPEIAERLRAAIAARPFLLEGDQPLPKTASIGFAAFPFVPSSARALSWTQVVQLADQALYLAKNGGRNTWAGLEATPGTDAGLLSQCLATAPESAIADGALEIISASLPVAG